MSKVIEIEYNLKDANTGEELDSNIGKSPLGFVSGKGQIISGLESKLVQMVENESADVMVKPKDGYGEYSEEAKQTLPKEQFSGIELTKGMTLYGQGEQGETVQVMVKSFTDKDVTIDYNHPMAGKTLMFSVTVLSSRDATKEEVETGVVGGMAEMSSGCCGGGHKHAHSDGECCSSKPKASHSNNGGCGCSH